MSPSAAIAVPNLPSLFPLPVSVTEGSDDRLPYAQCNDILEKSKKYFTSIVVVCVFHSSDDAISSTTVPVGTRLHPFTGRLTFRPISARVTVHSRLPKV